MYRRGDGEWRSFLSPKGTICIDPSGSELFCQDSNGKDIPVDGHFMCFGGGSERYAATRAWGWNHAFVDTALTAMAVEEETAMETGVTQIAGEHSAAESSHGRTAAAHGEAEAVASSVRASSHGEAEGGGGARQEEVEAPDAAVAAALDYVQSIVGRCQYYHGLGQAEVQNFVSLGLRAADTADYLTCRFCKNRRRKQLLFQGSDQVREHFMAGHVERGAAPGGVPEPAQPPMDAEAQALTAEESQAAVAEAGVQNQRLERVFKQGM